MLVMLVFGVFVVSAPVVALLLVDDFREEFSEQFNYRSLENYLAFVLLIYTASNLIRRDGSFGIYFSKPEIENLFSTPLSRRQLLGYRLFIECRYAILTTLATTMGMAIFFPNLLTALFGIWMVVVFARLLPILCALIGETAKAHAYNWRRKFMGYVVMASLGLVVARLLSQNQVQLDWSKESLDQLLNLISDSYVGRVLLFPFQVFASVAFSSEIDFRFALNFFLALAFNGSLVSLILLADANYLSVVDKTSRLVAEQAKQIQMNVAKKEYHFTLPMPPNAAGVGPIVWRHALAGMRSSKQFLPVAGMFLFALGYLLYNYRTQLSEQEFVPPMVLTMTGTVTLLFALAVPVGFKADINKMEYLKSLPLNDWCIVAGQVLSALVVASGIQLTILSLVALADMARWQIWLGAAIALVPLNYLVFIIASAVLLWFPVKTGKEGSTNIASLGHAMISMFTLIFGVLAAVGFCVGSFFLTQGLTGSMWGAWGAGFVSVTASGISLTMILVSAYRRFDVSRDTPI